MLGARPAAALDFSWSFFDTATSETIEGIVLGLTDNATSAATSLLITDDGTLSFPVPQETLGSTVNANSWTLVGGVITSVDFNVAGFTFDDTFVISGSGPFDAILFDELLNETRSGAVTFVPEPSTAALTALGLVGLAARRRRS
jgi:hypothetical protein